MEPEMKISVKFVVWSFAVVPFLVVVVQFCSLCQERATKTGPLSHEEMVNVIGGAEDEGCTNISRVCTGSDHISCGCVSHFDRGTPFGDPIDTTTKTVKQYEGEDFSSPNSNPGSNTKSQLVQVERKNCYKEVTCECIDYKEESQCDFSENCSDGYVPYSICVDWERHVGEWVTFKKGYCVDP
jgi:hypothetical protein